MTGVGASQAIRQAFLAAWKSAIAADGVASAEWLVSRSLPTFREYAAEWLLSSVAKDGTRSGAAIDRHKSGHRQADMA